MGFSPSFRRLQVRLCRIPRITHSYGWTLVGFLWQPSVKKRSKLKEQSQSHHLMGSNHVSSYLLSMLEESNDTVDSTHPSLEVMILRFSFTSPDGVESCVKLLSMLEESNDTVDSTHPSLEVLSLRFFLIIGSQHAKLWWIGHFSFFKSTCEFK